MKPKLYGKSNQACGFRHLMWQLHETNNRPQFISTFEAVGYILFAAGFGALVALWVSA